MPVTSTPTGSLLRLPRSVTGAQAARPAFVGDEPLSYGAFADRVDALASRLHELGAGTGDRVALWMDKEPRLPEAVFAALGAGCAYVPLDGGQPAGRVQTILADAEPVVLFTDARHLPLLAGLELPASLRALVVAGEPEPVAEGPGGLRAEAWESFRDLAAPRVAELPGPEPSDLAALLYTSGSTGVPKGVRISHRNLTAFIGWARTELSVGPGDVFANHASFNFDLSTFDLFTAFSVGAAVWLVPDGRARDVAALAEGIREHGVTVWYSVPSILGLLTDSGALTPECARGLRYVLFAGEVFPMPQLRRLAEVLPADTALYNLYGPTETNVCTYHRVRTEDLDRAVPVPIGAPVGDARLRVLDEDGREVTGPGAVGELVVEGDCVTPGYWRRPGESAAAGHPEGRHATGDLVSSEDGLLVYRGRKDRMVKLHGYRVELGEIETAVLRHPDIATAAVVLEGPETDRRIAVYYTLHDGADRPSLLRLKQHCARHLPPYMLPRSATVLDRLPYNANGKTEYHRLGGGTADSPGSSAAPAGSRPGPRSPRHHGNHADQPDHQNNGSRS